MPIAVKDWKDSPDTSTPLTAAALEDMETRMGAYSDTVGSNAVILNPTSSVRNRIVTPGPTSVALTVKGSASQTNDLQHWTNSSDSVIAKVGSSGIFTAASLVTSGDHGTVAGQITTASVLYATAPQQIQMSPVGSSTWHDLWAFNKNGGIPVVENFTSGAWTPSTHNPDMFAQQDMTPGHIINGTTTTAARWTWGPTSAWQFALNAYGWLVLNWTYSQTASSVKDILFETSADGVTWTTRHLSTGVVMQSGPSFHAVSQWGDHNYFRVTVTVTNGVQAIVGTMRMLTARWGAQGQGREVEFPYTWNGRQQIAMGSSPTTAQLSVRNTNAASDRPLVLVGASGQSGNLQEWQNSAFALQASIDPGGVAVFSQTTSGKVTVGRVDSVPSIIMGTNSSLKVQETTPGTLQLLANGYDTMLSVRARAGQTLALQDWEDSAGVAVASLIPTGVLASNGLRDLAFTGPMVDHSATNFSVVARTATQIPLVIRGAASQTSDLQQWQNSASVSTLRVGAGGNIGAGAGPDIARRINALQAVSDPTTGHRGIVGAITSGQTADNAQTLHGVEGTVGTSGTGANTGIVSAIVGTATHNSSGSSGNFNGGSFYAATGSASGGASNIRGIYTRVDSGHATNPVVNAFGITVANNVGAGPITNNTGVQVNALSGTSSAYGVSIAAPSAPTAAALHLPDTGNSAPGGIRFGSDTNLFRAGADVLRTDDNLQVGGSLTAGSNFVFSANGAIIQRLSTTAASSVFVSRASADINDRFSIMADGAMSFGPGNAAFDTNLYRGGANILQTDDSLVLNTAGTGVKLKSPDGLTTRTLTIDNAGALVVA